MPNEWIELTYRIALFVVAFLFYNVLAPAIKTWTATKMDARITNILTDAVKAAEQSDTGNSEKKQFAMEVAAEQLSKIGIEKTADELSKDIETAVYVVKKEY